MKVEIGRSEYVSVNSIIQRAYIILIEEKCNVGTQVGDRLPRFFNNHQVPVTALKKGELRTTPNNFWKAEIYFLDTYFIDDAILDVKNWLSVILVDGEDFEN